MTKTKNKNKNTKNKQTQRKGKSSSTRPTDPAAAIRFPFESPGFKWPDERTSQSAMLTSQYRAVLSPATIDATNATTFSWALNVTPYPDTGLFRLGMNVTGNLRDTNAAGTTYVQNVSVPNLAALKSSPGLIRCTGIGVRLSYEGTELQRSGRFVAGIAKSIYTPVGTPASGTLLSPMSTMAFARNIELGPKDLAECLTNRSTARVSDGVFEAHWRPSKVPQYMAINNASLGLTTAPGLFPADNAVTPLNASVGMQGIEAGQSSLYVMVEGDVVAAAGPNGNPFAVDIVWHWEYIPSDPTRTIISISPSPFLPNQLAAIINSLELGPTAYGPNVSSEGTAGEYVGTTNRMSDWYDSASNLASRYGPSMIRAAARLMAPSYGGRQQQRYLTY